MTEQQNEEQWGVVIEYQKWGWSYESDKHDQGTFYTWIDTSQVEPVYYRLDIS